MPFVHGLQAAGIELDANFTAGWGFKGGYVNGTGLLPVDAVWTVLSPMTVAVLDRRFSAFVLDRVVAWGLSGAVGCAVWALFDTTVPVGTLVRGRLAMWQGELGTAGGQPVRFGDDFQ